VPGCSGYELYSLLCLHDHAYLTTKQSYPYGQGNPSHPYRNSTYKDTFDMSLAHDTKPNADTRKEEINWLPEMQLTSPTDTISTSTWASGDGLTTSSATKTDSTATVTIAAGRLGAFCNLVNTVTTASGEIYTKTIVVEITPT
jgi:hypothetical protein